MVQSFTKDLRKLPRKLATQLLEVAPAVRSVQVAQNDARGVQDVSGVTVHPFIFLRLWLTHERDDAHDFLTQETEQLRADQIRQLVDVELERRGRDLRAANRQLLLVLGHLGALLGRHDEGCAHGAASGNRRENNDFLGVCGVVLGKRGRNVVFLSLDSHRGCTKSSVLDMPALTLLIRTCIIRVRSVTAFQLSIFIRNLN